MTPQGWFTLAVIAGVLVALIRARAGTDVILAAAVAVLVLAGVLTPAQALAGMANPGMISVAVLYVVVCGLTETGAVRWMGSLLLGRPNDPRIGLLRLTVPVVMLSAFVNNTPIVALMIPAVREWSRQRGWSASRFMMPLSYAAILGGVCTMLGTSTNLVIQGEWVSEGRAPLGLFSIAVVGLPVALAGLAYLLLVGRRLIPERVPALSAREDARTYTVEMLVAPAGPLPGRSIEQAGLRHLPGLFLAEVERDGGVLPAVGPEEILQPNDRLVFVGDVSSVVDLQKIRGLEPATDQVVKLRDPRPARVLVEAVVSNSHPLIGHSIREGRFRSRYNAVVIAAARNGERIRRKIGDIVLRPGDVLLLEAPRRFIADNRDARDYYLVSEVDDSAPIRHNRALLALGVLVLMVLIAFLEPTVPLVGVRLGFLHAAVLAAGLMLALRCCSGTQARRSVDWIVLITIAGSLGLAKALEASGAAAAIGGLVTTLSGSSPWVTLAVIYVVTMVLTELITNNAAALLMYFVAKSAADKLGVDFTPYVYAIMVAASCAFASPLGYQTHLMVMGPGGYRFGDFVRVGLPLNLLAGAITCLVIPLVFGWFP
jgi:di/tricarboxylate transporter